MPIAMMFLSNFKAREMIHEGSMRFFRASIFSLVFILFTHSSLAGASVEYKIKAAYIYNFTKFVTWPKTESDTFNLCILGKEPFGTLLNSIESRTAFGLPIKLIRLKHFDASKQCHILFLGDAIRKDVRESITSAGILTVSEEKQFAKHGGMIGFVVKNGKVKLQINLVRAKQAGLEISAKLLEISEIIKGNGDG